MTLKSPLLDFVQNERGLRIKSTCYIRTENINRLKNYLSTACYYIRTMVITKFNSNYLWWMTWQIFQTL